MMVNLARMILYIPEGVSFEFGSQNSFTDRFKLTWEGDKLIVGCGFEVRVDPSLPNGVKAINIYNPPDVEYPAFTRTTDRVHPYSPVVPVTEPWAVPAYPGPVSPYDTICGCN